MCFRLHLLLADSPPLPAESSSSSCGPPIRLRLLSTPPRGDAVSFNYGGLAFPDMDFHHVMSAPSRAHWERLSAAKIAPVMDAVMLFFAPSRLRVRQIFSICPSSPLKVRGDRGGLCAFAPSCEPGQGRFICKSVAGVLPATRQGLPPRYQR